MFAVQGLRTRDEAPNRKVRGFVSSAGQPIEKPIETCDNRRHSATTALLKRCSATTHNTRGAPDSLRAGPALLREPGSRSPLAGLQPAIAHHARHRSPRSRKFPRKV